MRVSRLLALAGAAGSLTLGLGLYACGSNSLQDGALPEAGAFDASGDDATLDGAAPLDSSSGSDAGDASAATDSNPPLDAPADAPPSDASSIPEGGALPDPGHVACADAGTCAVPANECCIASNGGGACKASNAACGGGSVATLKCDEAANCADAGVCCVSPSLTSASSACAASCTLGQIQLCRTHGECPSHDCTPQTCTFGGAKIRVEACGLQTLAGCTP